jgi:hypothetical protein
LSSKAFYMLQLQIGRGAPMCAPKADTRVRPYITKLGTNGDSPVSNSAIARSAAGSGQESVAAPIPSPGRNK